MNNRRPVIKVIDVDSLEYEELDKRIDKVIKYGKQFRKTKKWTEKEIHALKKLYGNVSTQEIVKFLGRTWRSVERKIELLKRCGELP